MTIRIREAWGHLRFKSRIKVDLIGRVCKVYGRVMKGKEETLHTYSYNLPTPLLPDLFAATRIDDDELVSIGEENLGTEAVVVIDGRAYHTVQEVANYFKG